MKGKYSGRHMTIYGYVLPGSVSLANWAAKTKNVSEKAKQRLKVVDWSRFHNNNISLTARHFGLDRETVRGWKKKFEQAGILGLNDKSHRPKNTRKPVTDWIIVNEIVKIRKQYPLAITIQRIDRQRHIHNRQMQPYLMRSYCQGTDCK